jgi:hypothetical protein
LISDNAHTTGSSLKKLTFDDAELVRVLGCKPYFPMPLSHSSLNLSLIAKLTESQLLRFKRSNYRGRRNNSPHGFDPRKRWIFSEKTNKSTA